MAGPEDAAGTKRAEILSSVGAGVLGAGLALLFADALKPYMVAIVLIGFVAHGSGMYQKHQIETQAPKVRVWWTEALYWLCWLALAVLLVTIVVSRL
ncbi:MAG: hypothetical protein WD688_08315 [Candidatus Binatia bacterium]